jgi:signal transduction histidine kinase
MGFVGLISSAEVDLDVVAVQGFEPIDPHFFERFRRIPLRPSVFGVVITERRPHISNDVDHDPLRVGQPPGHPAVRTFLGVPLMVGTDVIGMIGVANKQGGYTDDDQRLLSTFANQVAVAIDNARLYARQQEMIDRLANLHSRLSTAERDQLLSLERDRIAVALHDEIEQGIFSVGLHLTALLEREPDPESDHEIRQIRQLVNRTSEKVREVIFALGVETHPGPDLSTSIRRLLDDVASPKLQVDLRVRGAPPQGVAPIQGAVHAVVKEAIANVVQHASARTLLIDIQYSDDRLDVVVQDDGIGASERVLRGAVELPRFGLRNMRRQIAALGGTFEATNGDESGVIVRMSVPLTAPPAP